MEKKRDPFFLQERKQKTSDDRKDKNSSPRKRNDNIKNSKSDNQEQQNLPQSKKPFDKKTYRLKKYSKKYKLQQWEDQRKKKLLHNYYKDIQNESLPGTYKAVTFDEDKVDSNQESIGKFVRHPDLIEKEKAENKQSQFRKDPYWRAKEKFNKMKEDKLVKQKEMENVREEKLRKLQEYKKKKQEKFKKLSRKTKKGQPVMTGRMELLLEKLQKN